MLILGIMILVKAITVPLLGISNSWRGFYATTKLTFIHSTTNFKEDKVVSM